DVVQDDNHLYITTASQEKYVCVLPQIDSVTSLDSLEKRTDSELSAYQLLKPLFAREVCSYRLEQYWTYEICHGRYIRQFHEDSGQQKTKPDVVQDDNHLYITTASQEKYVCVLPQIDSVTSLDSLEKRTDSELSAYQLLKPLFAREVCSYRLEQYWTYEICHGRYIRQFHEDSGQQKTKPGATQEYYLGKYELSRLPSSEQQFGAYLQHLVKKGKKRPTITVDETQLPYIEINMTDGTLCDLSNTKRFTRVLYVCNEDAKHELYSIKETSTCEYEAIVLSPLLCLSPEFQVKNAPENQISCYSVDKSPAKPKGLKALEDEAKKQQLEVLKNKDKASPFAGGIFDGKTIIIGATDFGKELRINIISDDSTEEPASSGQDLASRFDSKILQNFLSGDLCLHGGTGWWRYEFCYGNKVEQYHEEKGVKKTVITLGKWDKREHMKWINSNPNKKPKNNKTPKQVSHYYSGGDSCDMTGKSRSVEVKMKCRNISGHPDSVALYLLEPKTCEYILGIESPIICQLLSSADENGLLYNPSIKLTEDTAPSDEEAIDETLH
ncbi:unnamed protein product, partial [Medioppia subpectinata]